MCIIFWLCWLCFTGINLAFNWFTFGLARKIHTHTHAWKFHSNVSSLRSNSLKISFEQFIRTQSAFFWPFIRAIYLRARAFVRSLFGKLYFFFELYSTERRRINSHSAINPNVYRFSHFFSLNFCLETKNEIYPFEIRLMRLSPILISLHCCGWNKSRRIW